MSEPEIPRRVRQQRADIDALYSLVQGVDGKVDALDVNLNGRIDALDVNLSGRMDGLDGQMGEISGQLSEVLRRLG